MKKKLLFLTSVLLLSAVGLSSCSKDEPAAPDLAKENVAGTKWLGYHKYDGSMTLHFYKGGTYRLDYDTMTGYSAGNYTQRGTTITFTETSGRQHWYNFSKGEISPYGMTLTIPMYYYDGDFAHDVKFTLVSD